MMSFRRFLFGLVAAIWAMGSPSIAKEPVDYADPMIGTSNSRWMLGPYACVPFGMVQLGPDNQDSIWMGGYEASINSIAGFSHIHAWTMAGFIAQKPRQKHGLPQIAHSLVHGRVPYLQFARLSSTCTARASCLRE